jgi:DNA-binding PadR family transcriptional regulator
MKIESKVLLLAILKKKEDENINDIIMILEDAGVFTYKEGKRVLKELKKDGYIKSDVLTFKGIEAAKSAELEFKL